MIRSLIITLVLSFSFITLTPSPAFAQPIPNDDLLGLQYGHETGLGAGDIRITVARIINVALGLIGMIFLVLIIYAGFKWMTAGGNTDAIDKAKQTISAAVIGLLLVLTAMTITNFVLRSLYKATTGLNYEGGGGVQIRF